MLVTSQISIVTSSYANLQLDSKLTLIIHLICIISFSGRGYSDARSAELGIDSTSSFYISGAAGL